MRRIKQASACPVGKDGLDRLAGFRVHELAGNSFAGEVPVAEGRQGHEHGPEIATLLRQHVLVARRMLGIEPSHEKSGVDEPVQPPREHVGCDLEARLKLVKTGQSVERVPQDEDAPPFAHAIKRARDRAQHVSKGLLLHIPDIRWSLSECKSYWTPRDTADIR